MPRRVVFTSLGIVSSLGAFPSQILAVMGEGSPVFERPPFDNDVTVCPIKGFDIRTFTGRYKNLRYLTRGAQFCVASAIQAVKQSGLKAEQIARAGLFVGVGPNLDIGGEFPSIRDGKIDMGFMAALWILKFLPNTAASAISHLAGIHGENSTIGTACSASLQAIGEAFRKVRDGYLDLAFAGGGDSRLTPGGILAYKKAEALWTGQEDCSTTYSPFDAGRKGFVPGEGGAFLLLEHLDHALARGARIYGEICGFGASMDGCSMTAPEPEGAWAEVAVHAALRDAKVAPWRSMLCQLTGPVQFSTTPSRLKCSLARFPSMHLSSSH